MPNIAQAIRDLYDANPQLTVPELVKELANQGIQVSENYVGSIRAVHRGRKTPWKNYPELWTCKLLVDLCGGPDRARQAIDEFVALKGENTQTEDT